MDTKIPGLENPMTLGMEEELFLVDIESGALITELPTNFIAECQKQAGTQIIPEFLTAQIELRTKPCNNLKELQEELLRLRGIIAQVGNRHGIAPVASSTHPFSYWKDQTRSQSARYKMLADKLQLMAHRMLICGMHLHVGLENDELRVAMLNKLYWYLPHLLYLSTSSPFWQGMDTGLSSMRLSVLNGLPRSGLPERFNDLKDYNNYLEFLKHAGVINDSSEVWWDARLNPTFPTVEMRITDVATRSDDVISIAAFYSCLMHWIREGLRNKSITHDYHEGLAEENRWRAQRYSFKDGSLIDYKKKRLEPVLGIYQALVDKLLPIAEQLDCEEQLKGIMRILKQGTSASHQRRVYRSALEKGLSEEEALKQVVDFLRVETAKNCYVDANAA